MKKYICRTCFLDCENKDLFREHIVDHLKKTYARKLRKGNSPHHPA